MIPKSCHIKSSDNYLAIQNDIYMLTTRTVSFLSTIQRHNIQKAFLKAYLSLAFSLYVRAICVVFVRT